MQYQCRCRLTPTKIILPLLLASLCIHAQEAHITQSAGAFSGGKEKKVLETATLSLDEIEAKKASRLEALRQQNLSDPIQLDSFGGWVNAPESLGKPQPGDYFRVKKLGGAWWFITPDGHPFVSKAVTDVSWLGATLSPGPFHDIIVEKYGDESTWVGGAKKRLLDWGFNSVGPWSSASIAGKFSHAIIILDMGSGLGPRHPKSVVTDYWDPAFAAHAAKMAQERAAPHATDKNLIGYFLDNEIVWGQDHFLTKWSLLQWYSSFPLDAPGRVEAMRVVQEAAGSIEQFNATWETEIEDWDALAELGPREFRPRNEAAHAVTDTFKFLAFEKYVTISNQAVRAVDPNHLILGCRFHNYPGDAMIKKAAQHFDVISMAFYEPLPPVEEIDAVFAEVDKPFLIEEWTFKSADSGIDNPQGIYAPDVRTEAERCLAYDVYVERFMRRPYGIGYHWYKWMDNPLVPERKGDNCGLIRPKDEPYQGFVEYISEVNRRVERWHAEGVVGNPTSP